MTRPKKRKLASVRFTDEEYRRIQQAAKGNKKTVSETIRLAMRWFLA